MKKKIMWVLWVSLSDRGRRVVTHLASNIHIDAKEKEKENTNETEEQNRTSHLQIKTWNAILSYLILSFH